MTCWLYFIPQLITAWKVFAEVNNSLEPGWVYALDGWVPSRVRSRYIRLKAPMFAELITWCSVWCDHWCRRCCGRPWLEGVARRGGREGLVIGATLTPWSNSLPLWQVFFDASWVSTESGVELMKCVPFGKHYIECPWSQIIFIKFRLHQDSDHREDNLRCKCFKHVISTS